MTPPPQTAAAELELADRARAGDRAALEQLYRDCSGQLYRHAVRMLRDEAAAQDAVQEGFARALAAIHRTGEGLRFKAWIFRIVTNLCLRQLTQRRRGGGPPRESADGADPGPEERLRRAQLADLVLAALEQLPPRYRQILVLRELDELSYDEVGAVMELDRNRVKVTLHRARARLGALVSARRLLAEPQTRVACAELGRLLSGEAGERQLVRHLERCRGCRKGQQRPAAELLALLPPVTMPRQLPLTPAPAPAAAAGGVGGSWTGGLLLASSVALVLAVTWQPAERRERRLGTGERGSGTGGSTSARARPAAVPMPPHAALLARNDAGLPPPPVSASPRKLRAIPQSPRPAPRAAQRPLAIRLQHRPGTLNLRRGLLTTPLSDAGQLRAGDVLLSGGATFGVRLPRGQWLVVQGSLRLDVVPRKGQRPRRVEVTLLSGQLRAKATELGGGLLVRVGASRCTAHRGRFRVRAGRVESLEAYVTVEGPHAPRKVGPGSGLALGPRPGFAHRLLPAPLGLRPVRGCFAAAPTLSWRPAAGASGYIVQLAADTDFADLSAARAVSVTSFKPGSLRPGKYYWRVLALREDQRGAPSKIFSFTLSSACPRR